MLLSGHVLEGEVMVHLGRQRREGGKVGRRGHGVERRGKRERIIREYKQQSNKIFTNYYY